MRDIKFRAWSSLDEKMYQCYMKEDIQDYFNHNDGITLMQYTGLKDKNGVEIYEGDILNLWQTITDTPYIIKTSIVEFNVKFGGWYNSKDNHRLNIYPSSRYEVIGNIHKNKHLIKQHE